MNLCVKLIPATNYQRQVRGEMSCQQSPETQTQKNIGKRFDQHRERNDNYR